MHFDLAHKHVIVLIEYLHWLVAQLGDSVLELDEEELGEFLELEIDVFSTLLLLGPALFSSKESAPN